MAFLIDQDHLPAVLTVGPMTDQGFAALCSEHPDLSFELTADGELLVMPPTFSKTGARNQRIGAQLLNWADADGRGTTCDSSTGFVLPNGARRSPDACWIANERIAKLPPESREQYWRLCPDFVIELRSSTDRLRTLREKMQEWIDNGAALGWLIDPDQRTIEVYRHGCAAEVCTGLERIAGEGPVQGFVLELSRIWEP